MEAWGARPTDFASCWGVEAGEPGYSGSNQTVRPESHRAREWKGGVGWAAETREAREERGATRRRGIAVMRRGRPAGLTLCVTLGPIRSWGLTKSAPGWGGGLVGEESGCRETGTGCQDEKSIGCPLWLRLLARVVHLPLGDRWCKF